MVTYTYDEWGYVKRIICGRDEEKLANSNPIRYRGYYYDTETGYYYLQSRYYDPSICRFINADVIEIAQEKKNVLFGLNLFVYCTNDPINYDDFTGSSSEIVVNYYYRSRGDGKKGNPFGHLDIKIGNTIYSYAQYQSGNLLVTTKTDEYLEFQETKYNIKQCPIKVTSGQKKDILSFYKYQKKLSKYKAKSSFDKTGSSNIYKINSGNYKTYKLTSCNCSTFVLDGLREAFSLAIIIYRIIQMICYPFQVLDTPKKVFEICRWLANSR